MAVRTIQAGGWLWRQSASAPWAPRGLCRPKTRPATARVLTFPSDHHHYLPRLRLPIMSYVIRVLRVCIRCLMHFVA